MLKRLKELHEQATYETWSANANKRPIRLPAELTSRQLVRDIQKAVRMGETNITTELADILGHHPSLAEEWRKLGLNEDGIKEIRQARKSRTYGWPGELNVPPIRNWDWTKDEYVVNPPWE